MLDEIEREIIEAKTMLEAATEIIDEGNKKLRVALSEQPLNKVALLAAHAKVDAGLERKRKSEKKLEELQLKKQKLK